MYQFTRQTCGREASAEVVSLEIEKVALEPAPISFNLFA
jgi:hypothetical protein